MGTSTTNLTVRKITPEQLRAVNRPGGIKFDQDKPRWDLVPWEAMREVTDVLTSGAKKYSPDNWKRVPNRRERYFSAAIRHLTAWWGGESQDPETGKNHLSHAICCLLFLLWEDLHRRQR